MFQPQVNICNIVFNRRIHNSVSTSLNGAIANGTLTMPKLFHPKMPVATSKSDQHANRHRIFEFLLLYSSQKGPPIRPTHCMGLRGITKLRHHGGKLHRKTISINCTLWLFKSRFNLKLDFLKNLILRS